MKYARTTVVPAQEQSRSCATGTPAGRSARDEAPASGAGSTVTRLDVEPSDELGRGLERRDGPQQSRSTDAAGGHGDDREGGGEYGGWCGGSSCWAPWQCVITPRIVVAVLCDRIAARANGRCVTGRRRLDRASPPPCAVSSAASCAARAAACVPRRSPGPARCCRRGASGSALQNRSNDVRQAARRDARTRDRRPRRPPRPPSASGSIDDLDRRRRRRAPGRCRGGCRRSARAGAGRTR